MKVFIDTNIFLDMIVLRENHLDNENAAMLLKIADLEDFDFYISPITISTSFYLARKEPFALDKIKDRLEHLNILPMDNKDVQFAMNCHIPDREDAMQISCADRGNCDLIITRDSKHFKESPIPVYSPSEFIEKLKSGN